MDYQRTIEGLSRALSIATPRSGRQLLAPELSYGRHHGPASHEARRAAVLLLIYPRAAQSILPLTLRHTNLSVHAGQISFPGGSLEPQETPEHGAAREWTEELGSPGVQMEWLGRLTTVYVFNSNFLVTPCVAAAKSPPQFQVNPAEVDGVLEMPLEHLLDESHYGQHWIERGSVKFRAPHIEFAGQRIWGATAIMLEELLSLLHAISKD